MKMAKKYVYFFGKGKADGNTGMKNTLGGKGANLAEMTNLSIPVPPGFTISAEICQTFDPRLKNYPSGLHNEIERALKKLENAMGARFGDNENPLLVSVRSGAAISMPGMMDTVLNIGLNDKTIEGLIQKTNNPRFAYDAYRRFIQMFGDVVLEVGKNFFEEQLEEKKKEQKIKLDTDLSSESLKELVEKFKEIILKETGNNFPDEPRKQLQMAIDAVFSSWNNQRAITYRKLNDIKGLLGTAVNVQVMVYGNMGTTSGTGVAFTRDPANGENKLYGEYLINAQGEDVVAGIRNAQQIAHLKKDMPENYKKFARICKRLEKHYRDIQDIEFTIQEGKLYILQTRTGKRTARAAVTSAVDMVKEGLINREEALKRIEPKQLDQLMHPTIDPKEKVTVIAKGLAASPGAVNGKVVFEANDAVVMAEKKEKVILVRPETTPEDIHGMAAAQGILTARGGMTSHAAVVARGMGKCCVAGCDEIKVDVKAKKFITRGRTIKEGEYITLNGSTGEVLLDKVKTIEAEMSKDFATLLGWADKMRRLGVRANADTPKDATTAFEFGAEGIGLCRTEHMFFAEDRLPIVREMILAQSKEERQEALNKLLPMQRNDFKAIFKVMKGNPVTIRLLDPPLHEFLPSHDELLVKHALEKERGKEKAAAKTASLLQRVAALKEMNPMLGHRGCRLGVTFPEVYKMQAQAILEAAASLVKKKIKVLPEIMIPVVGHADELKLCRKYVEEVAKKVMSREKVTFRYAIGTMIELPRACITAGAISQAADFFSFGTNDLTQTTLGYSRDDAEGKFIPDYIDAGILEKNPFDVLDQNGVGELVKMGVEKGRKAKPNLKIGICGEHGGEPSSVEFCHKIGLDYVSCSPYRVPIARLAAAQASLNDK